MTLPRHPSAKSKPKPKDVKINWPLCHACALKAGGKPLDSVVTMTMGACKGCGKETGIAGYRDYSWPNGDKAIWD